MSKCDYCDEEATWIAVDILGPDQCWCQHHHEMWVNLDVPSDIWELVMLTMVAEESNGNRLSNP